MHTRTGLRRACAVLSFVALAAAAAACSSDEGSDHGAMSGDHGTETTTSSGELPDGVNAADVGFVTGMIPHHEQAIEMSDMVLARGADPRVVALAEQIKAAQQPEIDRMLQWLDDWGVDRPDAMAGDHMDDGMADGMMDAEEMGAMGSASGAELDRMFLESMIRHHRGAVAMARTELADGEHEDATALASAVIEAQEAEIAQMEQLLAS